MRLTTGYEYKKARIELIPLLDVVFLLLVFFIYAILSMSVHQGVRVTLPVATGEAQQKTEHKDDRGGPRQKAGQHRRPAASLRV